MDSVAMIRVIAGVVAVVLVGMIVARRRRMAPNKR